MLLFGDGNIVVVVILVVVAMIIAGEVFGLLVRMLEKCGMVEGLGEG